MIDLIYLWLRDLFELNETPLRLLHFTHSRVFLAFLTAFFIALWTGPKIVHFLYRNGLRDRVRDYDSTFSQSKSGTPTMGGLLIVLSLLGSVVLWCNPYTASGGQSAVPLLVMTVLLYTGIGALDDWLKLRGGNADAGLSRRLKLLLQALFAMLFAALILNDGTSPLPEVTRTQLYVPFLPAGVTPPDLGFLYFPFIVFTFLGIANAINFADGLDGLAIVPTGATILVFGVFGYFFSVESLATTVGFAHVESMAEVSVFCGAAFGAALGFLWFNAYPAQVFMGDTGSMALGGLVAGLAVITKTELIFLIVGGIFVYEFLSVFVQDLIGIRRVGRRLFFRAPAHHGLQHRGIAEPKVVTRFWIISFVLGALSIATLKFR